MHFGSQLLQSLHHIQQHVFAPVSGYQLHTDGQTNTATKNSCDPTRRIALLEIRCGDPSDRNNAGWRPDEIVERSVTLAGATELCTRPMWSCRQSVHWTKQDMDRFVIQGD